MRRLLTALGLTLLLACWPATAGAATSAGPIQPTPASGALFFPSVAGSSQLLHLPHFCSASVLHSTTRDLLVTAAHCVYGTGLTIEFAPGYHDGVAPYGLWTVRRAYVARAWLRTRDPHADVAVLEVAPRGGRRIEDVTGGLRYADAVAGQPVSVSGYPIGTGGPVGCTDILYLTEAYPSIDCSGLVDGVSGGPWLQAGRLVGVTGGLQQGGCADTEYSAPLAGVLPGLLSRAEAGARGDVVPIGFLANAC